MYKNELLEDIIASVLIVTLIVIVGLKRKAYKDFNYRKLVTTLNYTLLYVAAIGITLLITPRSRKC